MWVMTGYGVLMPSIRPPDTVPEGDEMTLQVRSRRAMDLDKLRDRYMGDKLGPTIYTPKFDYEYRAYCRPEDFGEAMKAMVDEIDYEKFKPICYREPEEKEANSLHSFYNSVWSVYFSRHSTPTHRAEYYSSLAPALGKNRKSWWEERGTEEKWWETGSSIYKPGGDPQNYSGYDYSEWNEDDTPIDPEVGDLAEVLSEFDRANEEVLLMLAEVDSSEVDYGTRNGRKPMTKRQRAAFRGPRK